MSLEIKISSKALVDIRITADWYNIHKDELGNHFKETVKNQINFLSKSPKAFSIKYLS